MTSLPDTPHAFPRAERAAREPASPAPPAGGAGSLSLSTTSRQVMNPPARRAGPNAEAGNLANTAPLKSDPADQRRGLTGTSSGSEARPVTATARYSPRGRGRQPKLNEAQRRRLAELYAQIRDAKREMMRICAEGGITSRKDCCNFQARSAWQEYGP